MPSTRATPTGHHAGLLMAMAAALCAAGLNALVKHLAGRGLPILEILFFRSLFALIPVVGHIAWKPSTPACFKTSNAATRHR